jgi:hypothetical protein
MSTTCHPAPQVQDPVHITTLWILHLRRTMVLLNLQSKLQEDLVQQTPKSLIL